MMRALTLLLLAGGLTACGSAPKRDLDLERLRAEWESKSADYALAPATARQVSTQLEQWQTQPPAGRDARADLAYAVESQIKTFEAEVDLARSDMALAELDEEATAIRLAAAKRAAEMAHLDAVKARAQSLVQAEEAERLRLQAQAEAEQRARIEEEAEFARQEAEAAKQLAQARAREAELIKQEAELVARESESLRLQLAGLREVPRPDGLALVLGDVFFDSGQGSLKPEARASVSPVLAFLDRYPDRPVRIEGHTDSRGSDAGNLRLSEQRAASVREALIAAGAPASRLEAVGKGETEPLDSNDSDSGRARNRRVEIVIVGAK